MSSTCCIPNCNSERGNVNIGDNGISLHQLPKRLKDRNRWISIIREKCNYEVKKNSQICTKHFHKECFLCDGATGRKTLKIGSAPTLFLSTGTSKLTRSRRKKSQKSDDGKSVVNIADTSTAKEKDNTAIEKLQNQCNQNGMDLKKQKNQKELKPTDTINSMFCKTDKNQIKVEKEENLDSGSRMQFRRDPSEFSLRSVKSSKIYEYGKSFCDGSTQTIMRGNSLITFLLSDELDSTEDLENFDAEKLKCDPVIRCYLQDQEIAQYRKRIRSLQTLKCRLTKRIKSLESMIRKDRILQHHAVLTIAMDHTYSMANLP